MSRTPATKTSPMIGSWGTSWYLTVRALRAIAPAVEEELAHWQERAAAIPDEELRSQALASLHHKRFHAEGGSVYALLAPGRERQLVRLIVGLQTISDYLDNLCDRSECDDLQAYRHLHRAMLDAVDPQRPIGNYYRFYPRHNDGGYLDQLVDCCRREAAKLPRVQLVLPSVLRLLTLYNDLQVYKHGPVEGRRLRLERWFDSYRAQYPELYWWEFAAASGSTLGSFALLAAAADADLDERTVSRLEQAYFPWIGGLHILLDYFIDQAEDRRAGDLNLVEPYGDGETRQRRLAFFQQRAAAAAGGLPFPAFHRWVVQGLPALYLSDPKIKYQGLHAAARQLVAGGGPVTRALYLLFRLRRSRPGARRESLEQPLPTAMRRRDR